MLKQRCAGGNSLRSLVRAFVSHLSNAHQFNDKCLTAFSVPLRPRPLLGEGQGKAFHGKIIDSNLADYQHLTRRTLDAAGWFKRYAQGLLGAKTTDGETP